VAAREQKRVQRRPDDFEVRRRHLEGLTDEQLKQRFWQLTEEIVSPLVDLARTHTSPSVERSVLLRMGFSSLEAKEIVERVLDHGLLGKGAGNVVARVAAARDMDVREAGLAMMEGQHWDEAVRIFRTGGESS
jgi:D-ornithine 4,5-aminomutase subunit alpha